MEGDSAVQAIYGPELDKLRSAERTVPPELAEKIAQTRDDYDRWLDARYAAARGHLDALIDPLATRRVLDLAFELACAAPFTEHLPIQLTTLRGVTFVEPDRLPAEDAGQTPA
jgi:acetyl-CoA carboxylase carboxyltransferase component